MRPTDTYHSLTIGTCDTERSYATQAHTQHTTHTHKIHRQHTSDATSIKARRTLVGVADVHVGGARKDAAEEERRRHARRLRRAAEPGGEHVGACVNQRDLCADREVVNDASKTRTASETTANHVTHTASNDTDTGS